MASPALPQNGGRRPPVYSEPVRGHGWASPGPWSSSVAGLCCLSLVKGPNLGMNPSHPSRASTEHTLRRNEHLGQVRFDAGARGSAPAWAPLCSKVPGILTALSQEEAAALLGVTSGRVCDIDTENVVGHEVKHIHMARVLGMRGVVGGAEEAAGGDLVLQVSIWVLPSRREHPVMPGGRRGSLHAARSSGLGGFEVRLRRGGGVVTVHQQFPREGVPSPEAFLTGCVWARLVCLQGTGNSPPYIGQRLSTLEFSARPLLPSLSLSLPLSIPSAGSRSYRKDANTSGALWPPSLPREYRG